jgi:hypothetical protein
LRWLPKPKLLQALFEFIIPGRESELDANGKPKRPIVQLLREVIELAARNHQPMSLDTWEKNQASGFFGNPLGSAATAS